MVRPRREWGLQVNITAGSRKEMINELKSFLRSLVEGGHRGEMPMINSEGKGLCYGGGGGTAYQIHVDPLFTDDKYHLDIEKVVLKNKKPNSVERS